MAEDSQITERNTISSTPNTKKNDDKRVAKSASSAKPVPVPNSETEMGTEVTSVSMVGGNGEEELP